MQARARARTHTHTHTHDAAPKFAYKLRFVPVYIWYLKFQMDCSVIACSHVIENIISGEAGKFFIVVQFF